MTLQSLDFFLCLQDAGSCIEILLLPPALAQTHRSSYCPRFAHSREPTAWKRAALAKMLSKITMHKAATARKSPKSEQMRSEGALCCSLITGASLGHGHLPEVTGRGRSRGWYGTRAWQDSSMALHLHYRVLPRAADAPTPCSHPSEGCLLGGCQISGPPTHWVTSALPSPRFS